LKIIKMNYLTTNYLKMNLFQILLVKKSLLNEKKEAEKLERKLNKKVKK